MSAINVTDEQDSFPIVRSNLYRLLAIGFKYPTRAAFNRFQNGRYLTDLSVLLASLPEQAHIARDSAGMVDKVQEDLKNVEFGDFESTYVTTFDVGFPEPPCPPYEGFYNDAAPRAEIMLEVSSFYNHFGLAMSQDEGKRELPDYLCVELEFLHFLSLKEAQALGAGKPDLFEGYRRAQKDFLERHLAGWLPKFLERVDSIDGLQFYPDLTRLLAGYINSEYSLLSAAIP